ncbi:MAG TPA: glycosyltransferase family 4 protein [Anaerolineales bacterium]|jgi:glycosyltransferase involved in cell wall biosynthesis|nr:glycosyltransferase family 4 protein [Anaerolineales bacterium]
MQNMQSPSHLPAHRLGFVSTRFDGTDGVSLETRKWAQVLERLGQSVFYFAGVSDQPEEISFVVPEAHFLHKDVQAIADISYRSSTRPPEITHRIHELRSHLKGKLYEFIKKYDVELLIVENALSIPMNIPLGLALAELIAETGIPVIGHHHDFFWERKRFLVNCISDYLEMAFPPRLASIHHVVINSLAAAEMGKRRGIDVIVIPNVMDFDNPPAVPDEYTASIRTDLQVSPDEFFFLQPTRPLQRKGIEYALELIRRLDLQARLVISHAGGDEGGEYMKHMRVLAELMDVRVNFVSDIIKTERGETKDGRKIYTLGDVYPAADLVTYPSLLEGFGNAFLEAVYYRRPIFMNNYTIYSIDIKPKGFRAVEFNGFVTDKTVQQVQKVLQDREFAKEMTEHNYELGKQFYSFTVLEQHLRVLLHSCFSRI